MPGTANGEKPQPADLPTQPGASQPQDQTDSSAPSRAELETRLAELQAQLRDRDAPAPIRMKVEGPHTSFSYGGVAVGTEYTDVPATHVAALVTAADEAGVTITQES